jgi:hypothetical protein
LEKLANLSTLQNWKRKQRISDANVFLNYLRVENKSRTHLNVNNEGLERVYFEANKQTPFANKEQKKIAGKGHVHMCVFFEENYCSEAL